MIEYHKLKIDNIRLEKIRYIAEYEQRPSLNNLILVLIKKYIKQHERKNGEIIIEELEG